LEDHKLVVDVAGLSLHQQPCYADLGYREGDFPVSEELARSTLAIPIYPELTRDHIEQVVTRIQEFYV
jgi:dTDP-4-amino-4,6-dideoxygalactose transaminase